MKSEGVYSLEALSYLLAHAEMPELYLKLNNFDIEFSDSVVTISEGLITCLREWINEDVTSISCNFSNVTISYNDEREVKLSCDELLMLEHLTKAVFNY